MCINFVVFKSCLDVQTYNNTRIDGEYPLQIGHPICNQTVQIYCADMNSSQPLEYLTLKAGSGNNFSKKNYVGSSKQEKSASSKTQFSKVHRMIFLCIALCFFVVSCIVLHCTALTVPHCELYCNALTTVPSISLDPNRVRPFGGAW